MRHGGLAQLAEHLFCTQGVRSSNLLSSTIIRFNPRKRDNSWLGDLGESIKSRSGCVLGVYTFVNGTKCERLELSYRLARIN